MKRGYVDLSELLKSINLKVDSLTKQVESLSLELKFVKAENTVLRQRLAKYEEPDKDSHNSSTPASKESLRNYFEFYRNYFLQLLSFFDILFLSLLSIFFPFHSWFSPLNLRAKIKKSISKQIKEEYQ